MAKKTVKQQPPAPPTLDQLPLVNASEEIARWLEHYWQKLRLPRDAAARLAVTTDRQEFAQWTGRRLNPLALGCYCFLPNVSSNGEVSDDDQPAEMLNAELISHPPAPPSTRQQPTLPGFDAAPRDAAATAAQPALTNDYRHLIFIEPDLMPISIEVTVAHELIHLRDRVSGNPRKHRCHGFDAIFRDEAAVTARDPEFLRAQLREETIRREAAVRLERPYRYMYVCPVCRREYPRVRRYARPVSCGRCDRHYNMAFLLELRVLTSNAPSAHDGADAFSESAPAAVAREAS